MSCKSIVQAPLLGMEKQVPSTGEVIRVTLGSRSEVGGEARLPEVPTSPHHCPVLPRAPFFIAWLAPCVHSPGFTQSKLGVRWGLHLPHQCQTQ